MTPLRQRVIEECRIRNLSPHTEYQYLLRIQRFAEHFGRRPEELGPNEIRQFQMHLLREGVSADIVAVHLRVALPLQDAVERCRTSALVIAGRTIAS